MLLAEYVEGEQDGYIANNQYVHRYFNWFLYGDDIDMSPV